MSASRDSAARFLELRSGRRIKLAPASRPAPRQRRPINLLPEVWRFVESQVQGCYAAWMRDVGEDVGPHELGVNGPRNAMVVHFCDNSCRQSYFNDCTRCRKYVGGKWVRIEHQGMQRPTPRLEPAPQIEEHW